jgi:hypothetical protein
MQNSDPLIVHAHRPTSRYLHPLWANLGFEVRGFIFHSSFFLHGWNFFVFSPSFSSFSSLPHGDHEAVMHHAIAALAWLPDEDMEVPSTPDLEASSAECVVARVAGSSMRECFQISVGFACLKLTRKICFDVERSLPPNWNTCFHGIFHLFKAKNNVLHV